MNDNLSKTQKVIAGTVSSIGVIGFYTGGVSLAKYNLEYHNPIFVGTIIVSFISPHLLNFSTTYILTKYNDKRKSRQLKK